MTEFFLSIFVGFFVFLFILYGLQWFTGALIMGVTVAALVFVVSMSERDKKEFMKQHPNCEYVGYVRGASEVAVLDCNGTLELRKMK